MDGLFCNRKLFCLHWLLANDRRAYPPPAMAPRQRNRRIQVSRLQRQPQHVVCTAVEKFTKKCFESGRLDENDGLRPAIHSVGGQDYVEPGTVLQSFLTQYDGNGQLRKRSLSRSNRTHTLQLPRRVRNDSFELFSHLGCYHAEYTDG